MIEKNKAIIRKVNEAFAADDTEGILFHVADDIRWVVAGFSTAVGKEAFREEIHNEAFEGAPVIKIINEIGEGDFVAAEGTVLATLKGGQSLPLLFHNTYRLENGKIKEMTSYVVPEKTN